MNIITVSHYTQNFFNKVIEPTISKAIIDSTVSLKRELNFSYTEEISKVIGACADQELLDEVIYVYSELLKNKDLMAMYFNYIYLLIDKYCNDNKINYQIIDDKINFNFSW